jgi:hypothetical protein
MKLDALFYLTVPGPKMIWQFGELGYDISIDEGGRTSEKPIKWDYLTDRDRYKLYMFYRLMNALRRAEPVFGTNNYLWSLSSTTKRLQLTGTDTKVDILGNFGLIGSNINPAFPQTGKWYEYFTDDSITVTNVNDNMFFQPGEYRLYSTKRLPSLKILLDIEDLQIVSKEKLVTAYPNPSHESFNFVFKTESPVSVTITIYNLIGKIIRQIKTETTGSEPVIWDGKTGNGSDAPEGIYLVQFRTLNKTVSIKIVKN